MFPRKFTNPCMIALFIVPALALGNGVKLNIPPMRSMKSTRSVPLSEALEKSKLCDFAKMSVEIAASMEEEKGSEFKVYKTSKPVPEVLEHYAKVAEKNGMADAAPMIWDNSKGKKDEKQPKDCSGTLVFSIDSAKGRLGITIVAYRAEKGKTTTVYVFLPPAEKKDK